VVALQPAAKREWEAVLVFGEEPLLVFGAEPLLVFGAEPLLAAEAEALLAAEADALLAAAARRGGEHCVYRKACWRKGPDVANDGDKRGNIRG